MPRLGAGGTVFVPPFQIVRAFGQLSVHIEALRAQPLEHIVKDGGGLHPDSEASVRCRCRGVGTGAKPPLP
jgi:hypothetical protein